MSGALVSTLNGCLPCICAFSAPGRPPPSEEDEYEKLRGWDSLRPARRWHINRVDTDRISYRTRPPLGLWGSIVLHGLH